MFFPPVLPEEFTMFSPGETIMFGNDNLSDAMHFLPVEENLSFKRMNDDDFVDMIHRHPKMLTTPDSRGKYLLHHYIRTLNVKRVTILLNSQLVDMTIKEDGMTAFELAKSMPPSKELIDIFKMLCFWELHNK